MSDFDESRERGEVTSRMLDAMKDELISFDESLDEMSPDERADLERELIREMDEVGLMFVTPESLEKATLPVTKLLALKFRNEA